MTWAEQSYPFQKIIECFARIKKDAFFIQIGCCDGVVEDIMHNLIIKNNWSGILLEPVKYLFEQLKVNYQKQLNLIVCNVAISNEDGFKDFWYLRENTDGLPFWYNQVGSFFPEVILKHVGEIPNLKDYLVQEKVKCITFNTLIRQHSIKQIDIMHIDTEGFDFSIIKQIDFENFKPSIIKYEHQHLIESDQWESRNYLRSKGYFVIHNYIDSIAFTGNFVDQEIIEQIQQSPLFII